MSHTDNEEIEMNVPGVIYLIRLGDEIVWCDDPAPDGDIDPAESVKYIRANEE